MRGALCVVLGSGWILFHLWDVVERAAKGRVRGEVWCWGVILPWGCRTAAEAVVLAASALVSVRFGLLYILLFYTLA